MKNRRPKGALMWTLTVSVPVMLVALLAVRLWGDSEYWRVAVPGYLTGLGTLALAALTYALLRQEAADRKALEASQTRERDEAALAEARKVIILLASEATDLSFGGQSMVADVSDVIQVLNAGAEPILDLRLVKGETTYNPEVSITRVWRHGSGGTTVDVVLPGVTTVCHGHWTRTEDDQDRNVHLSMAERGNASVMIAWTDSRGNHWARTSRSQPRPIAQPWYPGQPDPM